MRTVLLAAAVMIAVSGCQKPAMLPTSVAIVQPDQSVPTEYAAFSGIWEGKWGGNLDGKLAVETVSADGDVTGFYAWGDQSEYGIRSGSGAISGKITDGVLRLSTFSNGAKVTYRLRDNRALDGTYDRGNINSKGVFLKR